MHTYCGTSTAERERRKLSDGIPRVSPEKPRLTDRYTSKVYEKAADGGHGKKIVSRREALRTREKEQT